MRVWQDKNGAWHYDLTARTPSGEWVRERRTSRATSYSGCLASAQARALHLERHGVAKQDDAPTLAVFYEHRFQLEHIEAENLKPSQQKTIRSIWRTHLEQGLGSTRIDRIDLQAVQRLKTELLAYTSTTTAKRLSTKTVNNILALLRTMLLRAKEWKLIADAPEVKLLKRQKPKIKFHPPSHFAVLLDAAQRLGPRHAAALLLGGHAGLRAGEIIGLRPQDVDLGAGRITVEVSVVDGIEGDTKGYSSRTIPMTPTLAAALRACVESKTQARVLMDGKRPLTYGKLRVLMKQTTRAAGVEESGALHILRHTFATHLLAFGSSIRAAQGLLGHSEVQTTQGYTHLIDDALVRDVHRLEQGLGNPRALKQADTKKKQKNKG